MNLESIGKVRSAVNHLADLSPAELQAVAEELATDHAELAESLVDELQTAITDADCANLAAMSPEGRRRRMANGGGFAPDVVAFCENLRAELVR